MAYTVCFICMVMYLYSFYSFFIKMALGVFNPCFCVLLYSRKGAYSLLKHVMPIFVGKESQMSCEKFSFGLVKFLINMGRDITLWLEEP